MERDEFLPDFEPTALNREPLVTSAGLAAAGGPCQSWPSQLDYCAARSGCPYRTQLALPKHEKQNDFGRANETRGRNK